jgi:two-component system sensor histidine kinase PilS (NtrC family)
MPVPPRISAGTLPEPRRILSWVYVGRLCLAIAIFVATAWVWPEATPETTLTATLLFVASILFTGASFASTHLYGRAPGRSYLYGQVVFDVFLVATVVHLTGGKDSSFAPLYVLAIFEAAILLPIVGGVLIGVLASILYLADVMWSAHTLDATIFLQIILFSTVALVTGYLGDRLRRTGVALGEVETELRLLRLDTDDILASILTGILTVNGYGRLVYMNPPPPPSSSTSIRASCRAAGDRRARRRRAGLGTIIETSVRENAGVRRSQTGEGRDGMVLGVSTTVVERPEPEPPSVTAIFQDITGSRRLEALRRRAERLEAVAELSASLAHEIKNPLASIRSATEQLARRRDRPRGPRVLSDLVIPRVRPAEPPASRSSSTSRGEAARLPPVRGDVVSTPWSWCPPPDAPGARSWCHLRPPPRVAGDETSPPRLPEPGPTPRSGPAPRRTGGGSGRDRVRHPSTALSTPGRARAGDDTGPGVPPTRWRRLRPLLHLRPGGTGLGLALVQRAAEAHGGAVFVDEPRGGEWGATFTLYLPALDGSSHPAAAGPRYDDEEPRG